MMYLASRVQAGRMLAAQLAKKYRYENCAVVALDDGGVMVGAQIATQLHCVLTLLMSAEIKLPQEPMAVAPCLTTTVIPTGSSASWQARTSATLSSRSCSRCTT